MIRTVLKALLVSASLAAIAAPARAAVILTYDFVSIGATQYDEDGFRTSHVGGLFRRIPSNAIWAGWSFTPVSIASVDGSGFSLLSMDVDAATANQTFVMSGILFSGSPTSQSFNLSAGWQTLSFDSSFANVRSVSFVPQGNNVRVDFDNVRLEPAAVVPEPATLALVALGVLGALFARRKVRGPEQV